MNASLAALMRELESGQLKGRGVGVRKSEAAPLSENAEQNSNYCRANAQRELRKCEECDERAEERKEKHAAMQRAKEVPTRPLPVTVHDRVLERDRFQCS